LKRRQAKFAADRNLPQLAQALDATSMKPALQGFFRREYPGRSLQVQRVNIGKIYHKPGKNCEITYGVRCRDGGKKIHSMWFQAKMPVNGKDLAAEPRTWPGCGFWKPVSVWPEMNMVLYAFPYDRRLPYLGQLLEMEWIKQQVERHWANFGLPAGAKCQEVVCEKIKYMPGKRCVLRYEIKLAGLRQKKVFYGKTYNDTQSRYVFQALQAICASPACSDGRLNVPAPIAHLDEANTIWQHAWESDDLNVVMQKKIGWVNFPRTDFPNKIATMLAALHQIDITAESGRSAERSRSELQRGPSSKAVLLNAGGDASDIARFFPEKQEALAEMIGALEKFAPDMAAAPQTTIHGSFKLAQLLCRAERSRSDQQLGLIDFDSVACGDPLYDVAEFVASLAFLKVSDEIPAPPIDESIELYLASYQRQVPWNCDRRRLAWYVAAFLLGKIHASLKRREAKGVANIHLAFLLVQEWINIITRRSL